MSQDATQTSDRAPTSPTRDRLRKGERKRVTQMTQIAESQPTERAKVQSWRLHVLIEAGYPLPLAEKIAAALDADLHEAVELVHQGCDPRVAAEILL